MLDREIKARKLFYDAHDIESSLNWSPERIGKVDGFFFKSQWHRSHVPQIPENKVHVVSNGIAPS